MSENDPQQLSDELEAEAGRMAKHSQELQEQVDQARKDWQEKRADSSVPGAPPPAEEGEEEPSGQQTPPG